LINLVSHAGQATQVEEFSQVAGKKDDSARLAEIRDILRARDWEHDDPQYALEAIDRIVMDGDE
jgi:hypothetical protein